MSDRDIGKTGDAAQWRENVIAQYRVLEVQ